MSFPDEQLWIIRLERQSKKDSYIKPNFKQKSAILHPLLYWATFPYPTAGAKLHPLVLLPPKTTLSSLLTWGIFWLPRNFSAIKWQSSQACPGTVYYQSTSGELSDHKGWQIKLRSHWPNHRADRRNTAGGDRVGGTLNFTKYNFPDVYISQNGQKWRCENTCSFWLLPFTHILFKYSLTFKGASHTPP